MKKRKVRITNTGYLPNSPDRHNDMNIIPSNQITMKNVPFPIMGIDNLGNQQMMMPSGEYSFPGQYVTEIPMGKYQKGKEVKQREVVYTDPAKYMRANEAYRDSSILYDAYQFQKANAGPGYTQWLNRVGSRFPGGADELRKTRQKHLPVGTEFFDKESRENGFYDNDSTYDPLEPAEKPIIDYYKKLVGNNKNFRIGNHNSPDLWHRRINPIGEYIDGSFSPIYKKPEVVPIMKEELTYIEPKPLTKLPVSTPQLIPIDYSSFKTTKPRTLDAQSLDQTQRTGQYNKGTYYYNQDLKRWQYRPIDQEEVEYNREKGKVKKQQGGGIYMGDYEFKDGGLVKYQKKGEVNPKSKGWREYKTATGESLYLDPRFKDQRYYVNEKGDHITPDQNMSLFDVTDNIWESGTSLPPLEVSPRYKYVQRPGALGAMETVRMDLDNGSQQVVSPDVMATKREMDSFSNSFNPAGLVVQGASNLAQGNIGQGLTEIALSSPLVPRIFSKAGKYFKGAKPVEAPKVLPSSGNVSRSIKQSSNKINQSIIDDYTQREIDWLNSEEYIKRNMAATGKSRDAVIKEREKILNQINKTTLNVLDEEADLAAGVYSQDKNNPLINLFNAGNKEQMLNVADHEIKHAVSQQAIRSNDGLIDLVTNPYKNYPTVNTKKWYDYFVPFETTSKWASQAPEQQVVSKRIMDLVEKTQGVKRGTQLTDDNIKGVINLLNTQIKNGNPQNSDMIHMLSAFKSKFGENYYPIVKDMVNKAYALSPVIGAGYVGSQLYKNQQQEPTYKQGGIYLGDYEFKDGGLVQYQKGKQVDPNTNPNQDLTYKDNPEWFDNRAIYSGNDRYDAQIRKLVYEGKASYNPATKVMTFLKPNQQSKVDETTRAYSKDKRTQTAEDKKLIAKDAAKQHILNEHKDFVKKSALATGVLAAPFAASAVPSVMGALEAPMVVAGSTVPGVTVGSTIGAGFGGYGITQLPNTYDIVNEAYNNPTTSNITDAAEAVGMNALDFVGLGIGKAAISGAGKASRYLTTQTPARNIWKLNPYANKNAPLNKLYHKSNNTNLSLDDIDLFRVGESQGKRRYASLPEAERPAGFYTSDEAFYPFMGGRSKYSFDFPADAKIKDLTINGRTTDRIAQSELKQLADEGYDIIKGKNMIGQTEYIPLNKSKMQNWKFEGTAGTRTDVPGAADLSAFDHLKPLKDIRFKTVTPHWLKGFEKPLSASKTLPGSANALPSATLRSMQPSGAIGKLVDQSGNISLNNLTAQLQGNTLSSLEKEIISEVLPRFQGEKSFPFAFLETAVNESIVPLRATETSTQWDNIGLGALGYTQPKEASIKKAIEFGEKELKTLQSKGAAFINSPEGIAAIQDLTEQIAKNKEMLRTKPKNATILFSNKEGFGLGSNAHFENDTMGHSRTLVSAEEPDVVHILESQSDFAQGNTSLGRALKSAKKLEADIQAQKEVIRQNEELVKLNPTMVNPGDPWHEFYIDTVSKDKKLLEELEAELQGKSKDIRLLEAEYKASPNFSQKEAFRANSQDRLFQENLRLAKEKGFKKMRYPTGETTAKIQGYPRIPITQNAEAKIAELGNQYAEAYGNQSKMDEITAQIEELKRSLGNEMGFEPKHQTIITKYEKDVPKIIKKYTGSEAKIVTDAKGNTWYEIDVPDSPGLYIHRDGGLVKAQKGLNKRMVRQYPGMKSVYGDRGENLNVIKDKNFIPSEYGYGDIEFIYPGSGLVVYNDEYAYQSPTPDKYTAVYNPKGANKHDVFLDMMHGMRHDPEYMELLNEFSQATRNARGADMDYFFDQDAQRDPNFVIDGREQWDKNYIDGMVRAHMYKLASQEKHLPFVNPFGSKPHGTEDYEMELRPNSPEMYQAADQIYNYIKRDKRKDSTSLKKVKIKTAPRKNQ